MSKISLPEASNSFCPQSLFLYGTYKEDGTPNFALFSWFSYMWDSEFGVIASIGEPKLTLDLIREKRVFSANLVTEELLDAAHYCGTHGGATEDKVAATGLRVARGEKLDVPTLADSPWTFELEAAKIIELPDSGGAVLLCKIHNTSVDERLVDKSLPAEERLRLCSPVRYVDGKYFSGNDGRLLGDSAE